MDFIVKLCVFFPQEFYGKRPWLYVSDIYIIVTIVLFPAFPMHFAMNSVRYYKVK